MKSISMCLVALLLAFAAVSFAGEDDLCACTALWDPVCGVDGVTYSNDGCAACAGAKIECRRECPCRLCRCPATGKPVCGNDGKTYPSACEANCKGVGVACDGHCPCDCICPAIYKPVCGKDGKTYGNSCEAGCKGVKIACDGHCPCPDDCICTLELNPVCGVDGETYGNPCLAGCAKIPVDCHGECPCPCSKGVAGCKRDPCEVERCPAVPDAKCFPNFCGGCNAIFVKDGKVVNCHLPIPSLPPRHCIAKDKRCNAFRTTFPDEFGHQRKCCPGLECCKKCSGGSGSLTVAPVDGVCKHHCPDCK